MWPMFRTLSCALLSAAAALAPLPPGRASLAQNPPPATQSRFPVAHAHVGSVCFGYLYVSPDGIRYDVARPDKDKAHAFTIARSELKAVQPWNLFGQIQNAAEIRTARATYHLWLLKNDADVEGIRFWNPNNTAPVAPLMSAIQGTSATANSAPPPAAPLAVPAPPVASPGPVAAPPPADGTAAVPPGALEGIYWGWDSPNSARARYLFFTRDGWVYRDFPDDGIAGLNLIAFRNDPKRNKSWTGRYRLEEDRINILWQDYPDDREVIHRKENVANPPWDTYVPTCACSGKRFSGTYHYGLPASGQDFQFFPDGTFIDNKVTDQMIVSNPFVPGRYEHPRVLRGTYAIQDHTMMLSFADGRRIRRIFLAPKVQEDQGLFDWISLGGQRMFERHYQPQP